MNKICTDIKQSKKFIELGIDIKTADMHYMYRHWEIDENTIGSQSDASIGFSSDFYYGVDNGKTYHYIPVWSLSALLELIPSNVFLYLKLVKWDESYYIEHREMLCDNPIDAVFEMVCWLLENKKI